MKKKLLYLLMMLLLFFLILDRLPIQSNNLVCIIIHTRVHTAINGVDSLIPQMKFQSQKNLSLSLSTFPFVSIYDDEDSFYLEERAENEEKQAFLIFSFHYL